MDTYKKVRYSGFSVSILQKPVYNHFKDVSGGHKVSKTIFNEIQMKLLEQNPNVQHVSDRSISYKPEFKVEAIKENSNGKGPAQIFIEHGFDLEVIGIDKPGQCLKRWRKTYEQFGEDGFFTERRGKGATGRPSSKPLSVEDNLKKAEARIKYLEAELEFLKKLDELERQAKKKKK
jgi:transposase